MDSPPLAQEPFCLRDTGWYGIVTEDSDALHEELEQIRRALEALLGRPSRWSGVLELTDDPTVNGAKPFRCDIVINGNLRGQDVRWRTLIHEMLHAFSAGYNRRDFDDFPGWEEGVVEQTQRLLRPSILSQLGVTAAETIFEQAEANHRYNAYLRALETLRQSFNISPEQFYLALLSEPIKTRAAFVVGMARTLPPDKNVEFLRQFSAAFTILKERPK